MNGTAVVITLGVLMSIGTNRVAAQAVLPTAAEWRADLTELVRDIRLLHPDPFSKIGHRAFLRQVNALNASLPDLTDEERLVAVMRLVASIGDGHTMIEPDHPRYALWYPIRVHEFSDGYHVVSAHESAGDLAGAEVLAIAGRPIAEVARDARSLMGADNPSGARDRLEALHSAGVMRGLGYAAANGAIEIELRLTDGPVVQRTLTPSRSDSPRFFDDDATFEWRLRPEVFGLPFGTDEQWISAFQGLRASDFRTPDVSRPVHLTDRRPLGARSLPEYDAYYVRMNYVTDTDFIPFVREALDEVDRQRPRHLIVDWRQNFGGDGSKLAEMTREFIKRTDDQPWEDLYVLTGPKTFSAAVMALDAILAHVPATVVGEPSAAGLNHFGDPTWRSYPRTGIRLSVSTRWWQFSHSADLSEYVAVDVPAPFAFAEFVRGADPAVDPILAGEDMRSIPAIALAEGGETAAVVYEQRRERFGDSWYWSPPGEFELRQICDRLQELNRVADALATCQLNAAIHPDTWNVWYNLATAQRAAGLTAQRLASYRCVVAIAPDNWNVPTILEFLSRPGHEGEELPAGCPADGFGAGS